MRRLLPILSLLPLLCGCPAHTDYLGAERLTDHTAYTLAPCETLVGVGFPGGDFETIGGTIRLEHGLLPGLEVGTNLGRTVLGIINVHGEYMFLDTPAVAMSARLGFTWFNPRNVWLIPKDTFSGVGSVNLFYLPMALTASFPLARWLHLHLEANYRMSFADGQARDASAAGKVGLGGHEVTLRPAAAFYPGAGVALLLGVEVPVYSSVSGIVTGEDQVAPGVIAGARAVEALQFDVARLVTVYSAVHIAWRRFNLRLSVNYGLRFFSLYLPAPIPGLDLYWRF